VVFSESAHFIFSLTFLQIYFISPMHNAGMPKPSLEFHIKVNDYFGPLATVLDQVAQDLRKQKQKRHAETLARLRDDLTHLQANYRIEKAEPS
jgi:uncharacterized membrane protein YgaE (UPF0421/DUF939 family)